MVNLSYGFYHFNLTSNMKVTSNVYYQACHFCHVGSPCSFLTLSLWPPSGTCIWSASWHFKWPYRGTTAGCLSSPTGILCRWAQTMTRCLSLAAWAEAPPAVARADQLLPARGSFLKVIACLVAPLMISIKNCHEGLNLLSVSQRRAAVAVVMLARG